jgi:hypothetical protein
MELAELHFVSSRICKPAEVWDVHFFGKENAMSSIWSSILTFILIVFILGFLGLFFFPAH